MRLPPLVWPGAAAVNAAAAVVASSGKKAESELPTTDEPVIGDDAIADFLLDLKLDDDD